MFTLSGTEFVFEELLSVGVEHLLIHFCDMPERVFDKLRVLTDFIVECFYFIPAHLRIRLNDFHV